MSVLGAVFLGVGAMVGAGIFALLGEAGALAGSATWLSFLLGGVIAAPFAAGDVTEHGFGPAVDVPPNARLNALQGAFRRKAA